MYNAVRPVPLNMPSIDSSLCISFGLVKVRFYFPQIPIVIFSMLDLLMKLLGLMGRSSEIIQGILLSTWVAFIL